MQLKPYEIHCLDIESQQWKSGVVFVIIPKHVVGTFLKNVTVVCVVFQVFMVMMSHFLQPLSDWVLYLIDFYCLLCFYLPNAHLSLSSCPGIDYKTTTILLDGRRVKLELW